MIPHPENSVEVKFDGYIEENWSGAYHTVYHKDCNTIIAVPYDMMVSGYKGEGVSVLRLWQARSKDFNMDLFNEGEYMKAIEQNAMAEVLTKVL